MSHGKTGSGSDTTSLRSFVALVAAVALIAALGILLKWQLDANARRDLGDKDSMSDYIHRANAARSRGK
jgi:hypothetical protein